MSDAKRLAKRYCCNGVLILSFTDECYAGSAYGVKRAHILAIKYVSDQIIALIANGTIKVPDCL